MTPTRYSLVFSAGVWLLWAAGCASTDSAIYDSSEGRALLQQPTRNFRVAVPPVFLAAPVLEQLESERDGIGFTMEAESLRREFLEAFQRFEAFTDAIPLELPEDGATLDQEELVEAYLQAARAQDADFLVMLLIDELEFGDYEYSSVALLNGLVWLAIGPPSFFIDDRDYRAHVRLQVLTFDVHRGPSQARVRLTAQTDGYSMSLADRSQSQVFPYVLSILLPPFLNGGRDDSVSQALSRQVTDDLLLELSRRLKTEQKTLLRASDMEFEPISPSRNDGLLTETMAINLTTSRKLNQVELTVRTTNGGELARTVARLGHADLNEGVHPDVLRNIEGGRYVYRLQFPMSSWTGWTPRSDPQECFVRLIVRDDLDALDSRTYRFRVGTFTAD
ncbi:MAG: hypothetical protein RL885_19535 [Planctomycetota bacterium]